MPGFRPVLAVAFLAAGSSWHHLTASGGPQSWDEDGQLGVTSPLSDCNPGNGCTRFPDAFPVLYVQFVSDRALALGLAEEPSHPDGWTVVGLAGPLLLEKSGLSRTAVGFGPRGEPLIEHRVHLLFGEPLKVGVRYQLKPPQPQKLPLEFTYPDMPVSPSIQVNQVGYLTAGSKTAFVGNWLGSAGSMPVDNLLFEVRPAGSDRIVHEGRLLLVAKRDEWSGNRVYRADFGEVKTAGRYELWIPRIGRSWPFAVSETVYEPVYRSVFRLFYHARNSIAITAPWADSGWERPGGIPGELNALIHPSVGKSPLGRSEKPYSHVQVQRGWFDAGDYGQYVVNATPVWYAFGAGMDISQESFAGDELGIPESGNGIPDIIDELEWGMDWLLSMQDPVDGGVYHRVAPLRWDNSLPHLVSEPRFLFEKTTHATASFAAAAAIHARLLRPWKPERALVVLAASEAAWEFLGQTRQWPEEGKTYRNPPGVHAGEYSDPSAIDNRLWAAAELYRTTGQKRFLDAFKKLLHGFRPDPTARVSFRAQGLAAYWAMHFTLESHASLPGHSANEAMERLKNELGSELLSAADWYSRKAAEHPFNAPMHQHKPYTGWGTFAHSSQAALPLLQAWKISGDNEYRDLAASMSNPQLGANPQSICYITGVGWTSPMYPLSKLSQFSGQKRPMRGIPVNGPHYHLPALWPSTQAVNAAYQPAENIGPTQGYPALRRYVDSDLLPPMSEPTIAEIAALAVAFGLLADGSRLASLLR
jgi:hypothetical protein